MLPLDIFVGIVVVFLIGCLCGMYIARTPKD